MYRYIILAIIFLLIGGGAVFVATKETKEKAKSVSPDTQYLGGVTIDLHGKGLTKVPEYVFSRTDVLELDLSQNNLDGALQAEIRHLKNLRVLDLHDNNFTGVPAEIGQLEHLEILDLSDNRITGLPYELGNLRNLKLLNLSGNEYSELDLAEIKKNLSASTIIQTQ